MSAQSTSGVASTGRARKLVLQSSAEPERVRVLVAHDQPLALEGIRTTISNGAGLQIAGETTDGARILDAVVSLRPDVLVLDLNMSGIDAAEVVGGALARLPTCRIVALGLREHAPVFRRLLQIGVGGCLLKSSASGELTRCVHSICSGGVYIDPGIAGVLLSVVHSPANEEARTDLSARETEVLRFAALGHSTKSIAAKLNIGPKSVETYKARAMAKLGFTGRVELVKYAATEGWLGVEKADA